MDLIPLLKKDHKMVQKLFKEFEDLSGSRGAQKKPVLVDQIRQALTVHAQIEEELVYPVFQENRSLKDLVSEAREEHQVAKHLIAELGQIQPTDEQYDAKVKVLGEYVMHHVKEEEKEMFPSAQKRLSGKRLEALGEQLEQRRNELMNEGGDGEMGEESTGMKASERNNMLDDEDEAEEQRNRSQRGHQNAA
jgi:hemerythrin superfamily protein